LPTCHPVAAAPPKRRPAGRTLALRIVVPCLAALVAGCATYHREPLTQHDTSISASALERIRIDPSTMPLPALAAHRFDPSGGFDMEDVAMLAVVGNPDLKLARDQLGIAHAQAFSAGLLPDPQLGVSSDYPGAAGFARAFNYGLSMDAMALITHGPNKKSADASARQTDLGLLWQEWQVTAQAKQLFLKQRYADETLPLLEKQRELASERYARMAEAQRDGNMSADVVALARTNSDDAIKLWLEAARAAEVTHRDLNLLLGIAPDVRLSLKGGDTIAPVADTDIDAALAALPKRRPDLLALEAGYEAQEQKLRAAILSQFPTLSVGFVRARDTSEIYTSGFQISMSLPIFNRNRGNIAIEKATRTRLRDEYQTRVNQACADVAHLRADSAILARELARAQTALAETHLAAERAEQAYASHEVSIAQYTDAQSAELAKHIEVATLRDSLAEQRIGLQALLGSAIPDAFSSDQTSSSTLTEPHEH
jgi:outer membrane protein TolC